MNAWDVDLERVCVAIVVAVLDHDWARLEELTKLRTKEALVFGMARLMLDGPVLQHGRSAIRQQYVDLADSAAGLGGVD